MGSEGESSCDGRSSGLSIRVAADASELGPAVVFYLVASGMIGI
jgi:hypothetical protein